jgi:RNA polymerase sigma-70 factor, ECF subfamily
VCVNVIRPGELREGPKISCGTDGSVPIHECVTDSLELAALVERAKACDHEAWEALYRGAYPRLLAYASRRLDPEPAIDAVAETMARAVAAIDRFQLERAGFDGWLFGILRHVVLDMHRAAYREQARVRHEAPVAESGPLDALIEGEEVTALREAFSTLDPADQEILELRVVAGLSSDEVATVIGKRPGTVRMAQARALDRLEQRLQERLKERV